MAKRKYTKRSEYWDKFNTPNKVYVPVGKDGDCLARFTREKPFYTSDASYNDTSFQCS